MGLSFPSDPVFSNEQLARFFDRISLQPELFRIPSAHGETYGLPSEPSEQLSLLTRLQQHTLANVPFENLSIHYSLHHDIILSPERLYHKIVERDHGGYCMENNLFFLTILRSLGCEVYAVGARVSMEANGNGAGYGGWSHMVNIVAIEGKKYMIDVGFGAHGPIVPLLLEEKREEAGIHPTKTRVVRDWTPEQTRLSEDQKVWIYQQQKTSRQEQWDSMYAFVDTEFLPQDFEIMNFWTHTNRRMFFTYSIVVVKYVMDEAEQLIGELIMLGGTAKRRIFGETEILIDCKTEHERVQALRDIFGITLTQEERAGIKGLVTELKT